MPSRLIFSVALTSLSATLPPAAAAQSGSESIVDAPGTAGQFNTYHPAAPRDTEDRRVTTQKVMLLTGEPDIKVRVKMEDLALYIKAAEARAYVALAKNKTAMAAMVRFDCKPDSCETSLSSQGQAEDATLQALHDTLSQLPLLKVSGDVAFQIIFNIGP